MKNLFKIISIIYIFIILIILLTGCSKEIQEENQARPKENTANENTEIQINWESDTRGVKAAEIILKLETDMSLSEAENILLSNLAIKDDKYIRGQYKFPDGSQIRVIENEDTSSLRIDISWPEDIDKLANENVNLLNYKNVNGTYFDYINEFGAKGVLSSKYQLNSGVEMYNYYWIKDIKNYAHANFYKSTGKILSAQTIINGEQQSYMDD